MMKRIALAERPTGAPTDRNFRLEEIALPNPRDGEVLVEIHYMSLDPYMRGRMDDAKSYAAAVSLGTRMEGGGVGRVIATTSDKMADAVGKKPAGVSNHGCQQIIPAPVKKACEAKDADGEVGVGHLVLEGAVWPADLFSQEWAERQMSHKAVNTTDPQHPEGDPNQGCLGPSIQPPSPTGLQSSQQQRQDQAPDRHVGQQGTNQTGHRLIGEHWSDCGQAS